MSFVQRVGPKAGLLILAGLLANCFTLKTATVDRKTQLENQILGSFRRLEKELILASSVRSPSPALVSDIYRDAVRAHLNRAYNQDDLDTHKRLRQIGEANTGFIVVRQAPEDPVAAESLQRLVTQENADRRTILDHVIAVNEDLSAKDRPMVQRMMWQLNIATAKTGDQIQQLDDSWQTFLADGRPNNPEKAKKKSPADAKKESD